MDIRLSDHFTYKKLIRFSLPAVSSMIFTSIYGIVDGFFVSNYVGAVAFASLNLVMPFITLVSGVGFMLGAGGSALVAQHLGMQENEKANRYFSLIVYTSVAAGIILGSFGAVFAPVISRVLGATEAMLPYSSLYLRINMTGITAFLIQQLFQTFLITAEKPKLGFIVTLIAGCSNMFLDWLFVGVLEFGLAGAAWATVLAQVVGGFVPLVLFCTKKDWIICLGKTKLEWAPLAKACSNGLGEFLNNVSGSIVGFLYNLQLIRYAGENGVAAYGVIMYVSFIFVAIYIGYSMGTAPVISFHYGAQNTDELKSLYRKSFVILLVADTVLSVISELLAGPLSRLFVGYASDLCNMTVRGLRIYSIAFVFMGFNFFASAFFAALNNGKIAAIMSVFRNLILQIIMIFLLPVFLDIDGLWTAAIGVESFALIMTFFFLIRNGKKYGYR